MHTVKRLIASHAPPDLAEKILARIAELELRAARFRTALFGATSLAALSATGVAAWYALFELSRSSFASYASLALSDSGAITILWREFIFSLLESLPVLEITLVFISVFVATWSVTKLAYYGPRAFTHRSVQRI